MKKMKILTKIRIKRRITLAAMKNKKVFFSAVYALQ